METESLSFDLSLIEIPVTIGERAYILREASGDAACKYRNALLSCTDLDPNTGKPVRITGMANVEPLLVSLCLFYEDTGASVPLGVIKSWPSRILKSLFEKTKDISDLGEETDEEELEKAIKLVEDSKKKKEETAKNESEPTEVGST